MSKTGFFIATKAIQRKTSFQLFPNLSKVPKIMSEITSVRAEFPALQKCPEYVFGDAPTGTQCHESVAEAVKGYLENPGAHLMGSYPGAINTQATTTKARIAAAAFFNCKPEEVCILLMCGNNRN